MLFRSRVFVEPKTQSDEEFEAAPCPDFTLVSSSCAFQRGYRLLCGNPGDSDGSECYYVLEMFFEAAPKTLLKTGSGVGGGPCRTTGYKRVRFETDFE